MFIITNARIWSTFWIIRIIKKTRNKWNKTKIKYEINDEVNYTLEKLDVDLTTLELRLLGEITWLWRKNASKFIGKKITEIKRLKEETENSKDELLDNSFGNENKFSEFLADLEYEKHDALHNILV